MEASAARVALSLSPAALASARTVLTLFASVGLVEVLHTIVSAAFKSMSMPATITALPMWCPW